MCSSHKNSHLWCKTIIYQAQVKILTHRFFVCLFQFLLSQTLTSSRTFPKKQPIKIEKIIKIVLWVAFRESIF